MNTRLSALLLAPVALLGFSVPAFAENFEGAFAGTAAGYSRDEVGPEFGDGTELSEDLNKDAAYVYLFAGYDREVAIKVRMGVEAAIGIGVDDKLVLNQEMGGGKMGSRRLLRRSGRVRGVASAMVVKV